MKALFSITDFCRDKIEQIMILMSESVLMFIPLKFLKQVSLKIHSVNTFVEMLNMIVVSLYFTTENLHEQELNPVT